VGLFILILSLGAMNGVARFAFTWHFACTVHLRPCCGQTHDEQRLRLLLAGML
jgi:hypothetical protein